MGCLFRVCKTAFPEIAKELSNCKKISSCRMLKHCIYLNLDFAGTITFLYHTKNQSLSSFRPTQILERCNCQYMSLFSQSFKKVSHSHRFVCKLLSLLCCRRANHKSPFKNPRKMNRKSRRTVADCDDSLPSSSGMARIRPCERKLIPQLPLAGNART